MYSERAGIKQIDGTSPASRTGEYYGREGLITGGEEDREEGEDREDREDREEGVRNGLQLHLIAVGLAPHEAERTVQRIGSHPFRLGSEI